MKIKHPNSIAALGAALALMVGVASAGAQSLQFNGVNQSVQVPSSASVALTGRLTVEAWINRAAGGVQHSIVEKYGCPVGGGVNVGGYVLRVTATDKLLFGVRDDCNNGASVTGGTSIAPGVWTHVAGEWDGANLRVFINGVQDGVLASGRPPRIGSTALKIGERGNGGTPFNGLIDEVRLWNVARSAADIAANRALCLTGTEAGLAGYWRLDEGAGLVANDSTANGNTGNLVNNPAWVAFGAVICGPPPAPIIFDALEIFPPVAPGPLTVPAPLFTGAVSDTTPLPTNGFVGVFPAGAICDVVMPGATIVAINTDPGTGGQEFLIDAGGGDLHFVYTAAGTLLDPVGVGSIVKVVATRTMAPGPVVAEVIRVRPVAGLGFDISLFLFNGIVSQATPAVWTIGGVDFNIVPATGALPTDIDPLIFPVVPGVTTATVLFAPSAAAIVVPPPPPGAALFDALEIFDPLAPVLAVPAPLFRGARADTSPLPPPAFMPPGTIVDTVLPGATVVAINTDAVTGGREFVVDSGGGVLVRVYTFAGTLIRDPIVVGSVVKIVGSRTLAPGPIVADVIRLRPVAGGGIGFLFLYQGIVTRADATVWTIGGVDFNIGGPASALPTDIALVAPLVLGTTPATVLFSIVPGVVIGPPTLNVTATDAAAAEAGSDPAVFTITRTGVNFVNTPVSFTLTGTALNGTDYTAVPLSVLMPVGAISVDVTITPIADNRCEPTETVIMTLTASTNYFVGVANTATATIADDGMCPTELSILATMPNASKAGPTNGVFTVSRLGPNTSAVTVSYTIGGTAVNGTDYVTLPGSVTLDAGVASTNIIVTPIPDLLVRPTLTVTLSLIAPPGFILGTPSSATVFIANTNGAPNFALQFNGTSQLVSVPHSASLNLTTPFTIEAWINRAAVGVQHSIVEKYGCPVGGGINVGGYVLRVTAADKLLFGVRDDCNNGVSVTGNTSIPANTWVHVAGHWDGQVMRVFVNGVQDAPGLASNRPPKPGSTPLKIGERGNAGIGNTFFNGMIDEVRIWNGARSAAQLNANKGLCIPAGTPNLRGYWKMDEGTGATTADSSGNANTGSLINAPAWVPSTVPLTCP